MKQEQRKELMAILILRVKTLVDSDRKDMPDVILARLAANVVDVLTILYPLWWGQFGTKLIPTLNNHIGLCSHCGDTEIPAGLSHPVTCKECMKDVLENEDVHTPNPPHIESQIVEIQIKDRARVNNLDSDFLDYLERLLEHRKADDEDGN